MPIYRETVKNLKYIVVHIFYFFFCPRFRRSLFTTLFSCNFINCSIGNNKNNLLPTKNEKNVHVTLVKVEKKKHELNK